VCSSEQAQTRCTTQQERQLSAQRAAAQTGVHFGDFAASCCSVLKCSVVAARWRASRAKTYPRYLVPSYSTLLSSHRPRRRPTQAEPHTTPNHPIPSHPYPPPSTSLPRYFLARCVILLFACPPQSILLSAHPAHTLPDQSLIPLFAIQVLPSSLPGTIS
jgi:hypothetical protein